MGPALSGVAEAFQTSAALSTDNYTWLLDKPTQALKDLNARAEKGDPTAAADLATVKKVLDTQRTTGGGLGPRGAGGPERVPGGQGHHHAVAELSPLRHRGRDPGRGHPPRPHRRGSWWPSTARRAGETRKVLAGARLRRLAHMQALERIGELEPLAQRTTDLLAMLPKAMEQWSAQLAKARQSVFSDPALQTPLTRPLEHPSAFRKTAAISKKDQLHAVVGEGGLADQMIEQIRRNRDPDQIGELAKAMKSRLSQWGPDSVKATDHPDLAALYQTADAFEQWAKAYRDNAKEVDKAVHGEVARQKYFAQDRELYRSAQRTQLKDRQ